MAETPSGPAAPRLPRPPRSLNPGALLAVLFGGALALVGSIVTGFGLVFFWIFFMRSELAEAGSEGAAWQGVSARVILAEASLYDPGRPDRGVLLDTLPVVPAPGRDGVLRVAPSAALARLTAPALCLLPHAAWAVWRYAL